MRTNLIILFLQIPLFLLSQESGSLVMDYNLYDNTIKYSINGEEIENPSVKRGQNIYVNILEFNPYVMKAEVSVRNSNYMQSSSGYDGQGYISGGGSLGGISGLSGGLTMGSDLGGMFSGIPGPRGAQDLQIMEAKTTFRSLSQQLAEVEADLNSSYQKIQMFKSLETSRKLATADIYTLKNNVHIKPSRLKDLIVEEIQYAFAKQGDEDIDINDMINEVKMEEDFNKAVDRYNKARNSYMNLATDWVTFSNSVNLLSQLTEDLQFQFVLSKTDSVRNAMTQNISNSLINPVKAEYDNSYFSNNASKMAQLRQTYEEMKGDIFVYKFPPVQADDDEVIIDIKIRKKEGLDGYSDYKSLTQTVPVSGGWKITPGLGLSFGILSEKAYTYSLVNNTIVADEQDAFTPNIASFAHIFKQSNKNVSFGGSFGIGFPLFGGNGVQSASFFLGPTVIVGRKQKFLISGGMMGAKVRRLGSGLEAGDMLESVTNTIPTIDKYELGYFISISYDIIN